MQPWLIAALVAALVLLTAGSLSRHQAWWVRGLDFPRLQFAAAGLLTLLLALLLLDLSRAVSWALIAATSVCTLYQAWWILPFTRLFPFEVKPSGTVPPARRLRFMVANVLMPNRNADGLLAMVRTHAPQILLAIETDSWWERHLDSLAPDFPYALKCPLDNLYGMHIYSKLPIENARIQYLVEPDVPSMHMMVLMPGGERIRLHCLHPAPPSPSENASSSERDAELVVVGRSVAEADVPVVVTGDLNDVAWSRTTRLFRKISGLLDPRVGRAMVNSYHAGHRCLRWPLDHLFHSEHFTLCRMQRLPSFGSDHFPILVELALEPERASQQAGLDADRDDHAQSRETARAEQVSKHDVHTPGRQGSGASTRGRAGPAGPEG